MTRARARTTASLSLALGMALGLPVPTRGDDQKDQTKRPPAAATGAAARADRNARADKGRKPAGISAPVPATSPAAKPAPATAARPVSFIRDVAPILVENCIACHNPRKSESKYVMTTFAQLAKGGQQGEGMTIVPGKSDESYFIDVILEDADPRMPYKLDPLPQAEIKLLEKWVAEGA